MDTICFGVWRCARLVADLTLSSRLVFVLPFLFLRVFFSFCRVLGAVVMGKAEGRKELWHGHVTAVTVAPEYRRLGVAKQLMDSLETVRKTLFKWRHQKVSMVVV